MSEKSKIRASFKMNSFNIDDTIKIDGQEKKIKKDEDGNFIYKDQFGNTKFAEKNSNISMLYQNKYTLNPRFENGEIIMDIKLIANENAKNNLKENLSEENLLKIKEEIENGNYIGNFHNKEPNKFVIDKINNITELAQDQGSCPHCGAIPDKDSSFCSNCGFIFLEKY